MFLLLLLPSLARANDLRGFWDLLVPEVVGETGDKTYDLRQTVDKDGNDRFVGNATVSGGQYVGAGFGIRALVSMSNGFTVGGEIQVTGGRIENARLPFAATSTAMHYEATSFVGYTLWLEPILALHAGAVLGFDGMQLDVAGPAPGAAPPDDGFGYSLSRFDLRAGAQVGAHLNLSRFVAVWADGTYDWDGQYRVRAGLAFGGGHDARW